MSEWQPIETAPKDGTEIIMLHGPNIVIGRYYVFESFLHGKLNSKSEGWMIQAVEQHPSGYVPQGWLIGPDDKLQPRYWVPLPERPKR